MRRGTAQSPERKPADDRRREIADAALRVIADHGLGRFTAVAMAREVGLTDAALFRHFPSKEAIVLDLQEARGRDALHRVVRALGVDVFCCNTLPGRYREFGIDYETLSAINPKIAIL